MLKYIKGAKGFTLIELLVVVAIVAILVAIALPQYNAYRMRAYNAAARSDIKTFRVIMEAVAAETRTYPNF